MLLAHNFQVRVDEEHVVRRCSWLPIRLLAGGPDALTHPNQNHSAISRAVACACEELFIYKHIVAVRISSANAHSGVGFCLILCLRLSEFRPILTNFDQYRPLQHPETEV